MHEISNKQLGDFYIEEFESREEQDRVKVFDSDKNYLDYLPLERYVKTDPTYEEQYNSYTKMLEKFDDVSSLLNWLGCDSEFIGSKQDAIKYLSTEWQLDSKNEDLLNSEWVNRIGDVYIIVCEY